MKKLFFLFSIFLITSELTAQVSKTVNVTAGGLAAALTAAEYTTVTNLTVTGTIDARDFKTMRDTLSVLSVVDLSAATIASTPIRPELFKIHIHQLPILPMKYRKVHLVVKPL